MTRPPRRSDACTRAHQHMSSIYTYHIISYHIISYHIISYHIISYHIISYHIISYHIIYHISYHISYIIYHISYHIISYHIISYTSYTLYTLSSISMLIVIYIHLFLCTRRIWSHMSGRWMNMRWWGSVPGPKSCGPWTSVCSRTGPYLGSKTGVQLLLEL